MVAGGAAAGGGVGGGAVVAGVQKEVCLGMVVTIFGEQERRKARPFFIVCYFLGRVFAAGRARRTTGVCVPTLCHAGAIHASSSSSGYTFQALSGRRGAQVRRWHMRNTTNT